MQIGELEDGRIMRTRITGDQDPGYGSTSKMLAEAAVCLAQDDLDTSGGVLHLLLPWETRCWRAFAKTLGSASTSSTNAQWGPSSASPG